MNIHKKINLHMTSLVNTYLITRHKDLAKLIPKYLKSKSRYNTCYDSVAPVIPKSEFNKILNSQSDRVKTYILNNLDKYKYISLKFIPHPGGIQITHSLINDKPRNAEDLERIGFIRIMEAANVSIN